MLPSATLQISRLRCPNIGSSAGLSLCCREVGRRLIPQGHWPPATRASTIKRHYRPRGTPHTSATAKTLRRRDIDPLRSRIHVTSTAVQLRRQVTLDNEPKTTRSKRSVPVARSVMRRLEQHLSEFVDATIDALVFTSPAGGPLFRSCGRAVLRPAVLRAELDDISFHGLRHSFVAIMVAAGCNVREVSEWAGHNSVAFTLTRYGGLFEDSADAAVDRLDALLDGKVTRAISDRLPPPNHAG